MTFISLDDKNECVAFYENNSLHNDKEKPLSKRTWKYSPTFHSADIEYANMYCGGLDYDKVCPDFLKDDWESISKKAKAYVRSFVESKVSLKENCFYDLVPERFLLDYCKVKCDIIDYVLGNFTKPVDYGFKVELEILLNQIRNNEMNIDINKLKDNQANPKIKDLYNKLSNNQNYIHYNQFGSKTGRLTTTDKSFPILTLNKNNRDIILPNNDFFLELDYNAAEVRVFLALNGFKQPGIDIHMWNKDKFNFPDRNTAKNNFISWLYGKKNAREKDFKKIYNTDKIKNKYWDGNCVVNHYGRKIEADDFHSINYIVQSTTADLVLRQVLKLNDLLKNSNSKICMIIHDNVVIDMKKEDKHLIKNIINTYNSTEFGEFKCSVKIGNNLGNMKSIL